MSWLIQSIIISTLLFAPYWLLLRNSTAHRFNRIYLLAILPLSLTLPHLQLPVFTLPVNPIPASALYTPPSYLYAIIYAGISLVLLFILTLRLIGLHRLIQTGHTQKMNDYMLVTTDDPRAPFSFFSFLFWQKDSRLEEAVHEKIIRHELAHIRGGHSFDNVFLQLMTSLFWVNPICWLIRRELTMTHEFIADKASIPPGGTAIFARMLLGAYNGGAYLDPTNAFLHTPIQRRIKMIDTHSPNPNNLAAFLRKSIVLSFALVTALFFACTKPAVRNTDLLKIKLDLFQSTYIKQHPEKFSAGDPDRTKQKLALEQQLSTTK